MNSVYLSGTLTKDPDVKAGQNYKLASIFVETKRRVRKGRGDSATYEDESQTVEVKVWGEQATMVSKYFTAGSGIILTGRLKTETWDSNGKTYNKLTVVAETIEFPPGGKRATTPAAMDSVRQAASAPAPAPAPEEDDVPF